MSKRRMFNLDIVDTDVFLDMPQSSQMLYFHLGMRADDDGFVSPKKVMRLAGANHDDLQVLIAKRYVLQFPGGVVVIKHWPLNNYIQKDRYKPTTYVKEKESLMFNEFGAYTEANKDEQVAKIVAEIEPENTKSTKKPVVNKNDPNFSAVADDTTNEQGLKHTRKQNVSKKDTQSRLGKSSIGKVNNITTNVVIGADAPVSYGKPEINDLFDYWEETVGWPIRSKVDKNRKAAQTLITRHGMEVTKRLITWASMAHGDRFATKEQKVSDFVDLRDNDQKVYLWARSKSLEEIKPKGRGFTVKR